MAFSYINQRAHLDLHVCLEGMPYDADRRSHQSIENGCSFKGPAH